MSLWYQFSTAMFMVGGDDDLIQPTVPSLLSRHFWSSFGGRFWAGDGVKKVQYEYTFLHTCFDTKSYVAKELFLFGADPAKCAPSSLSYHRYVSIIICHDDMTIWGGIVGCWLLE